MLGTASSDCGHLFSIFRFQTFRWGRRAGKYGLWRSNHTILYLSNQCMIYTQICWFYLPNMWAQISASLLVIVPLGVVQIYNVSILNYFAKQLINFPTSASLLQRLSGYLQQNCRCFLCPLSKVILHSYFLNHTQQDSVHSNCIKVSPICGYNFEHSVLVQ